MERISDLELERYELDIKGILDNIVEKSSEEGTFEVYQAFGKWNWWFASEDDVKDLKHHLKCAVTILSGLQHVIR